MLTSRPSGRGPAATRRTALAGTLGGALAVAGCDAVDSSTEPTATSTTSAGSALETATTPPAEDPDVALVDHVVAALDELIAFTSAAAARPGVGRSPRAFERLHREHRAVLTDDPVEETAQRIAGRGAEVLRRVNRREAGAQRQLAAWAVAAESGPLARLLASMSAAIAQQLAAAGTTEREGAT